MARQSDRDFARLLWSQYWAKGTIDVRNGLGNWEPETRRVDGNLLANMLGHFAIAGTFEVHPPSIRHIESVRARTRFEDLRRENVPKEEALEKCAAELSISVDTVKNYLWPRKSPRRQA